MEPIEVTLNDRGKKYGQFKDHAQIAQDLKNIMQLTPNWSNLSKDKKEALDMIQHKVARILNGDPEYLDSWVDIIGYTQLVINNIENK